MMHLIHNLVEEITTLDGIKDVFSTSTDIHTDMSRSNGLLNELIESFSATNTVKTTIQGFVQTRFQSAFIMLNSIQNAKVALNNLNNSKKFIKSGNISAYFKSLEPITSVFEIF